MTKLAFEIEIPKPHVITDMLDGERIALSRRLRGATERVTRETVLEPLRQQVRSALKSRKLPTTWRAKIFPENASSHSLRPAGFVWSQTPELMLAFDQGATIRPVAGKRFLWIPTENVAIGRGGARAKPAETERRVGKFAFAQGKNGHVLAYARVGRRLGAKSKRKGGARGKSRFVRATRADKAQNKVESIIFYILVKQVTLRKRLDIAGVVAAARAGFPAALAAAASAS